MSLSSFVFLYFFHMLLEIIVYDFSMELMNPPVMIFLPRRNL